MGDHNDLGRLGEDAATAFLEEHGMRIVERNWRTRHGEIDIIAREGRTLVFCEVKTRRGTAYGPPLGAITPQKAARLRLLVGLYLAQEGAHPGPIRIDAIGILWGREAPVSLAHVRGVA
jgi:putative endonuclease